MSVMCIVDLIASSTLIYTFYVVCCIINCGIVLDIHAFNYSKWDVIKGFTPYYRIIKLGLNIEIVESLPRS